MKISRLFIAVSVLASALTSCSNALEEESGQTGHVKAYISPETRTTMGPGEDGAYKVLWSEGDEIMLSDGQSSYIYSASEGGSASASFLPAAGAVKDFSQGVIAGYPAEGLTLPAPGSEDDVIFTIPSVQQYAEGSFADGIMPMASAVSYSNELSFRNAAAVLRFVISGPEEVSVTSLTISTDVESSGECRYDLETESYISDKTLQSSFKTVLDCGKGVSVGAEGTAFHVVVPHKTYTSMTITAKASDGKEHVFKMKEGKELIVSRNSVLNIPLRYETFGSTDKPVVSITTRAINFTSFSVNINMTNVTSFACDLMTKGMFDASLKDGSLLASLAYATQYTTPMEFTGSITRFQEAFADVLIESGKTYVFWVVPYKADGNYTTDDIIYHEVTTNSYQPGGTSVITSEDIEIGMNAISMKLLASENVSMIFNIMLAEDELSLYPTVQDRIDLLIKGDAYFFEGSADLVVNKFLLPGKKYTLLAIGVDRYGYYGELFTEEYITLELPYNELSLSIVKDLESSKKNNSIKWDTEGGEAVSYRYILFDTSSYKWTNTLSSSIEVAEEKMILDPGLYYIEKTTNPYVLISGLTAGKEYVLVVTAIDAAGKASKPDSWIFTY